MPTHHFPALAAILAAASSLLHGAAAAAPIPIEYFFEQPEFSQALLSPSGKYLAAKVAARGGREGLVVVDLVNNSARKVAQFSDADVGNVHWISEERLLFDTEDKRLGLRDIEYGPGLYAVDRDGQHLRQLADRSGATLRERSIRTLLPWHTFMLEQTGAQDSDYVYVADRKYEWPGVLRREGLLRLNTRTGQSTAVLRPADTEDWLLDYQGEPRLAWAFDKGTAILYLREAADNGWRKLHTFDVYKPGSDAFTPLAFGPDKQLYVRSRQYGDKAAVHVFDSQSGKISKEPLVQLDGFDFSGRLIFGKGKLLGVRHLSEAWETSWIDTAMKKVQDDVDARLPHTINRIDLPARPETDNVLVTAESDRQPPLTYIYTTQAKTFNKVGESYSRIDPARMAPQQFLRYKARDGLEIPALLTLPNGSKGKKLPLLVLVHGGPWARASIWGWNPEAQFLASRGYAVLEPDFRGSTGYGSAHLEAGFKQWGLKMQDDVADGARWAIAQGWADPQRICIGGGSYGGYATLMGLLRDPELFKCGVNWVGVTDIQLMYSGHWSALSDLSERWREYGMPQLIGDPEKDAEQLQATSPLLLAARIRQPLLLAYGGADRRVPIYHGTKFRDAVKAHNKDVEWVEYAEEGHGWALPKNRIDFWGRVEKFLDRNIGAGAKTE
ncbi:S9 family peptidase [Massilia sp. NR 4-1]|uniref:alpha/beta hydrolase family protein n=1 Tax=Massilia sp. NR 4-1 TaxID=1678028 RepID=UPI00067CDAF4|nr:S9 family peptidase [Massilia sp. NR 4-1]AKU23719.1 dipeptidyl aminopeptidase [Massilia sp. NR 4-1]